MPMPQAPGALAKPFVYLWVDHLGNRIYRATRNIGACPRRLQLWDPLKPDVSRGVDWTDCVDDRWTPCVMVIIIHTLLYRQAQAHPITHAHSHQKNKKTKKKTPPTVGAGLPRGGHLHGAELHQVRGAERREPR